MTPAELLAQYERVWPTVRAGIPAAQVAAAHMLTAPLTSTDFDRIYRKGQRGWLEHSGGITRMTTDDLLVAAREEFDDAFFYLSWMARCR